jgi:hypothetical protein
VATLPKASTAVIVMFCEAPAVCEAEPVTTNFEALAAVTVIALLVPLIEPATVSVAVTVFEPTLFSVTLAAKVREPLSAGAKV